jgi:uncharacterized membrane protein YphA (DoxX/SURF4 family)
MLHPLISTVIQRPDLLVDHLSGYAALIHEEASDTGSALIKRGLAWAVAAMCAGVFLTLAGVALMLGLMLKRFDWVLVGVPAIMLLLLVLAVLKARQPLRGGGFAEVKAQVARDAQALRMAA